MCTGTTTHRLASFLPGVWFQGILPNTQYHPTHTTLPHIHNYPPHTQINTPLQPDHSGFCRVNYYPADPDAPLEAFGVHHHTDAGALTILLQDTVAGLEVMHKGTWHLVTPVPGALTINVGDQLQVWECCSFCCAMHMHDEQWKEWGWCTCMHNMGGAHVACKNGKTCFPCCYSTWQRTVPFVCHAHVHTPCTLHPIHTHPPSPQQQVLSNDKFIAPLHRVRASREQPRFSIPFFFNPSPSAVIQPLPALTDTPHYTSIPWAEFRYKRFLGDYADIGEEVQIHHYKKADTTAIVC